LRAAHFHLLFVAHILSYHRAPTTFGQACLADGHLFYLLPHGKIGRDLFPVNSPHAFTLLPSRMSPSSVTCHLHSCTTTRSSRIRTSLRPKHYATGPPWLFRLLPHPAYGHCISTAIPPTFPIVTLRCCLHHTRTPPPYTVSGILLPTVTNWFDWTG